MAMPDNVRQWLQAASLARYPRDVEQLKADALQLPIHEREEWIHTRTHEAAFKRDTRMASAEKLWPQFIAEAEQEFVKRLCVEFVGP